jgi:hypothetical protein
MGWSTRQSESNRLSMQIGKWERDQRTEHWQRKSNALEDTLQNLQA